MIAYLVLLVSCLVLMLIPGRKNQAKVAPVLMVLMILIVGLRSPEVGRDTQNYVDIYLEGGWRYEPLFQLIAAVSRWLGLGVNGFFTIMAVITFCPLFWFFRRASWRPVFSALIFVTFSVVFFHQTMNTVRASAALPFCLIALFFASRKEWWKTIVCFLIATGFHYSSLAVAALLLISGLFKKVRRKGYYALLAVSLLIGLFLSSRIGAVLGSITNGLAAIVALSSRTGYYLAQTYLATLGETSLNFFGVAATLLPFSTFGFLLYDPINGKSLYYRLFIIAVLISNVFLSVAIVYRVTMFLTPLITVLLPNTYKRSGPNRQLLLLVLTFLMILWYCYQLFTAGPSDMAATVPYRVFWV